MDTSSLELKPLEDRHFYTEPGSLVCWCTAPERILPLPNVEPDREPRVERSYQAMHYVQLVLDRQSVNFGMPHTSTRMSSPFRESV